nr:unnamed protein product [Callosobruchus chinensis]
MPEKYYGHIQVQHSGKKLIPKPIPFYPFQRTTGYQKTHSSLRRQEYNHREVPWSRCITDMSSARVPSADVQVNAFPKNYLTISSLEPVGTRAPKLAAESKYKHSEKEAGTDVAMFCPAQGFPVPAFR